jgi:hypothetical protein
VEALLNGEATRSIYAASAAIVPGSASSQPAM